MKYASLLCLLCLLFMANTCKKDTLESELIGKTWLHSYEEDEGDITVYRPNTYDFPPSRGRTGFALEEEGVFKQYDIAPTDGLEENIGRWEHNGKDLIHIEPQEGSASVPHYTLEIVSLKDDVLKVRKQSGRKPQQ